MSRKIRAVLVGLAAAATVAIPPAVGLAASANAAALPHATVVEATHWAERHHHICRTVHCFVRKHLH